MPEHDDAHHMQCMEVWGGNQLADSGVVMAGLDAWVYSKPYGGAEGGGDVYYVSSCATGRIVRLLVADVSGHGAKVSQIATGLRALMRKHVNQIDQARFVRSMNEQFATMSKAVHGSKPVSASARRPECAVRMFGRASTIRSANRLHWRRASASDSNAGTGGTSRASSASV